MNTPQPEQSPLLTKHHSFETMTQLVRWMVILIVSATFWALPNDRLLMLGLLVAAIVYNLLRMTPITKLPGVSSFITIIGIDLMFSFMAIGVTGGVDSPYVMLLAFMAMGAAYWYGAKGLLIVGCLETAFVGGLLVTSGLDLPEWPQAFLPVAFSLIAAYYVLRLTQGDRQERTELRRLNMAVQSERQQLESLVNSLGDGVVAVDPKGVIGLANQAAGKLFGSSELTGRPFDEAIALYDENQNHVLLFASGELKQEIARTDLSLRHNQEKILLELKVTPLKVNGDTQGYIIFTRDITKQKSLEEERDEFISLASHELRTPLAVAEGNMSLAMAPTSGQLNEKQSELLKKSYRNVRHLSAIVADLTTLEQADKGLLDVELERIDVGEVVQELVADHIALASGKGIDLSFEVDPDAKPVVTSKFRLVEILTNFLTNGIKYTPKDGKVIIKVTPDEHSGGAIVSVADTGKGISATEKQKIFDKFYRSEDYHTRETEGTGLGLYIVKKLALRLNGEVWLDSELGKGTIFYLRVPQYSKFREDQPKVIAADVDSFIQGV
jgi:PAS domain S-box-containing protein